MPYDRPELRDPSEELRTPELCLAAARNDGVALWFVPEKFRAG